MKISDIRASLQRLAERLDNQWAYARSDAEMDIAAGRAEYNDDGERLPTEPEISYYGMMETQRRWPPLAVPWRNRGKHPEQVILKAVLSGYTGIRRI